MKLSEPYDKLYDMIYSVTNAEIRPTYKGRTAPPDVFQMASYLDSPDGRVEQILLSWLDADRTEFDYTGTTIDLVERKISVVTSRLNTLHDTAREIKSLITASRVDMSNVLYRILDSGFNDTRKKESEELKAQIGKYEWLQSLFADYEQILNQDCEQYINEYQTAYRKIFGSRLREIRKQRGLTMEAVAKAIGMTYISYGRYEQGLREPTTTTLYKLCKVLNASADDIMDLR